MKKKEIDSEELLTNVSGGMMAPTKFVPDEEGQRRTGEYLRQRPGPPPGWDTIKDPWNGVFNPKKR